MSSIWNYSEMYKFGWMMELCSADKWRWVKIVGNNTFCFSGGHVSDLPLSVDEMNKRYRIRSLR